MSNTAFSPLGATLTVVTAAGTTAAQAIPGVDGDSMMVHNPNSEVKFIKFGTSAVAAATVADIVIGANAYMPFAVPPGITHCTIFGATAAQSVYVMRGGGM